MPPSLPRDFRQFPSRNYIIKASQHQLSWVYYITQNFTRTDFFHIFYIFVHRTDCKFLLEAYNYIVSKTEKTTKTLDIFS